MTLRELHLFAGIGGGILGGLLLGHRCVGAVEIDPYCRRVLEARQRDGILEPFPIHDDIRTFDGTAWRGRVDVVCGGYPCQPWSSAGKRLGTADPRHLWPEMARVVAECRPRFVFAENVSLAAFEEPWRDLRGLGYRVPPALRLGGCQVGAMYHRHRWWLLAADVDGGGLRQQPEPIGGCDEAPQSAADAADADIVGLRGRPAREREPRDVDQGLGARVAEPDLERREGCSVSPRPRDERARARCATECGQEVRDADVPRLAQREGERGDARAQLAPALGATWRASTPRLRRLVSGHARGMESRRQRIHAAGNAQVPAVAAAAFAELMARLQETA